MSSDEPDKARTRDWWLGATEPGRLINRRWRTTRPGDLHPRRRANDRDATSSVREQPLADLFDPASLFSEPAGPGAATAPAPDADAALSGAPSDEIEPWATLGLTSTAKWSEVAARHRELAKLHHPDRAGVDPTAARLAAERMASINAAYAELGKIYRLSGDR